MASDDVQTDATVGTVEREHEADMPSGLASTGAQDTPDLQFRGGSDVAPDDPQAGVPSSIEKAAEGVREAQELAPEDVVDAMEWLLGDEMAGGAQGSQVWRVNIGSEDQPRWTDWTITSVDADTMNQIRAQSRTKPTVNRAARRANRGAEGEVDLYEMNLRIVAAATVYPDLREAAQKRGLAAADPTYGPVELLRGMFRLKPGIVSQLAGFITEFSGYDEDDVVRATPEITMVRAAGNLSGRATVS